CMQGIEYPTF
nr:immunoglobulin light chain junction region [Macaca mulatta]